MIGLETERLLLRQWRLSDFDAFATFFSRDDTARYVGGIKTSEEAWRLMVSYIGHYELLGFSYLALVERATQRLVGTVGLWNSDPWPEPELGYWLLPESQGKGYGLEAGHAVKDFAFKHADIPSLVSYIDAENEPSKKLARRLGAYYDGKVDLLDFGEHEVYRFK